MKLQVLASHFAAELRRCEKIAPARPTNPIFTDVLLRSADASVKLGATDADLSLTTACPALVDEPGMTTLPVKHLLNVITALPEGQVRLTTDGHQVRLDAGTFSTKLQTRRPEDFPPQPQPNGATEYRLNGDLFRTMVRQVRRSITETDRRFFLNGALIVIAKQAVALVATDGKRLALATMPYEGPDEVVKTILSTKALDAVLQQTDPFVHFSLAANQIFFATPTSVLSAQRIDQAFPNYDRIVPRDHDKVCLLSREGLLAAVRRVALVNRAEEESVILALDLGTLVLGARHADVGEAQESLLTEYNGEPVQVTVNATALTDFLELASSPQIALSLKDARSALLLRDQATYLTVIMLARG